MRTTSIFQKSLLCLTAFATVALLAGQAFAHASLESRKAAAGSTYKAVMRITHGCDGSPTVRVRIRYPEGVTNIKPMPKPGWTIEKVKVTLEKPYKDAHGKMVTQEVREVVWSGGSLADGFFDEFVSRVQLPKTPDITLFFPVVQECVKGVHRWIQIPEAGKSRRDYREPAPELRLTPAAR